MKKIIKMSNKDIVFQTNAGLPRIYRNVTGRDLFKDMAILAEDEVDYEVLENVAYAMFKSANKEDTMPIEEWLEQFETFELAQILPEIVDMWTQEISTQSTPSDEEQGNNEGV